MREFSARVLVLCWLAASSGCALGSGPVARLADGREFEARAISAEAYGAYARGALFEAAGDEENALSAYQAALSEDGDSPEIHARIGAAHCRLARAPSDAHHVAALKSLSRATQLDPQSSSAWTETANCAARRGDVRAALEAALRAASADPVAVGSALLVAERAEAAGQPTQARIWLDELVIRAPQSREAWAALARYAARHADLGRELRARAGLGRLGREPGKEPARELDEALSRGDLRLARRAAIAARLAPSELALRLIERGFGAAAAEQAALVLGADPEDANAWITSVIAADLSGDRAQLQRALSQSPTSPSPLNPLAARLHAELLERLIGPEARAAWLAAQPR